MISALVALALAGAPPPAPWSQLTGPLGPLDGTVTAVDKGGVKPGERTESFHPAACKEEVAVHLGRVLASTLFTLSKVQGWLDANEGLELKLFTNKGRLGEVSKLVSGAAPDDARLCDVKAADGWKWALPEAPERKCKPKAGASSNDYWWVHGGKPAAVVLVTAPAKAAATGCAVRLSTQFFDQTGKARFRVSADQAGLSITLQGDNCQNVEFAYDEKTNGFKANPTSCKP